MATFTENKLRSGNAETTLVKLDLSSDAGLHALTYKESGVLNINCTDAAGITVNLNGDGVDTATCSGYGTIDVSDGVDVTAADGETIRVELNKYAKYLGKSGNNVTVTVTGATTSEGWYLV